MLLLFGDEARSKRAIFFRNPCGALTYFIRCFQRNLKHAQKLTTETAKKITE